MVEEDMVLRKRLDRGRFLSLIPNSSVVLKSVKVSIEKKVYSVVV